MTAPYPSRWPVQHPDRIQLYSIATPNGKKAGIMLEESGLPYEPHRVNIAEGEQHDPEYVAWVNPNGKIPSLIDPQGPDGEPLAIMESGALLLYLAEKSGRLLPADPRLRQETMQWLMFQMASVGPMFGQYGHFVGARGKTDGYGEARYRAEVERLLAVLDRRLEARSYLVGDGFSVADVATLPWVLAFDFYESLGAAPIDVPSHVAGWVERCMARPAVQRGIEVNAF